VEPTIFKPQFKFNPPLKSLNSATEFIRFNQIYSRGKKGNDFLINFFLLISEVLKELKIIQQFSSISI